MGDTGRPVTDPARPCIISLGGRPPFMHALLGLVKSLKIFNG
jgi:hypothetical protein